MRDRGSLLTALSRAVGRVFGGGSAGTSSRADVAPTELRTVEVDPRSLARVAIGYSPANDGDPDPGEIVWTWVPYEENDGRGKDRPVVIVAAGDRGGFLAVQLTSKPRDGDRDVVALGTGAWDPQGRPSWVRIDRIFRVWPHNIRREAASLDARRYATVAAALTERYGWR